MTALVVSPDNKFMLLSNITGDFGLTKDLNLPSARKLSKALDMTTGESIDFTLNQNNLEYKSKSIKFKYHLYDDGILTKSKLNVSKLESLVYDCEFDIGVDFFKSILKTSSVFNSTSKLYLYTNDDGCLVWSLEDRATTNTDVFSVVGDKVDFEISSFIMALDNLKMVTTTNYNKIEVKINNETGFGCFVLKNDEAVLNYIILSLIK
jgi:hypothetical protein